MNSKLRGYEYCEVNCVYCDYVLYLMLGIYLSIYLFFCCSIKIKTIKTT